MMTLFDEMTQQGATERAWYAAEQAQLQAEQHKPQTWAQVAMAWAAVAGQLPVAAVRAAREQIAVPVPRPLERSPLDAHVAAEQQAAADALHGRDPLDPRVPVEDVAATVRLELPPMHEPMAAAGTATYCLTCSAGLELAGGAWVDVNGGVRCVPR